MKKLVTIAIAALAGQLLAATITWTGGGDGYTWSDGGNWSSGSNPGAAFTDDLVIDGDSGTFSHGDGKKVIYTSGDMGFTGSLTIKGGATLYQDAISWPNFSGSVIVENGTFDMSHATGANNYGNVTIHEGGLVVVSSSFTRPDTSVLSMDGGELRIGGSFSFKPDDSVSGGSIVCYGTSDFNFSQGLTLSGVSLTVYIVVPSNGAKISLDGASLAVTCDEKGSFGFWTRHSGVLNFVSGSPSSYTFPSSYAGTAAALYSGMVSTGYITLDGSTISESDFSSKFDVSFDTEAGTCTMALKTLEGWGAGAVSVDSAADGQASVSFTVTKYSGGNATVSIGCASTDLGDDIANWAGKLTQVASDVAATTSYNETVALADGINYIRVFVAYDSTTSASAAAVARNIVYGDYGELTGVYEYIGSDGNLSAASNWALDKTPLGSGDTAPTAGTDIRWFGSNTVFALTGNFHLYATDHFVGATITQANAANHDSNLNGDVTFENSSVTLSTVVVQSEPHVISLKNSSFATTRAPDGVAGFWTTVPIGGVNFISGFTSSFSFGADAGDVHDAATVKSQLIDNGKITLDGAPITAKTWTQFFSVDVVGTTVTVSYSPTVAENRIDGVSTTSTSTSATLTATIGAQEDGTLVKFAYGTTAPTDADVLAGSAMTVTDGTATGSASGLTDLTVYHFTVAIVDAESTEILASKSGQFVASDFDYVYMNGAWAAEVPALNTASQVLFLDEYTTVNGNVNVGNKTVQGVLLRTGTLTGHGPLIARSAQISNTRTDDLTNAPFGTWDVTAPLFDFNSLSANGTIRVACSYTFYTKRSDEDIYGEFFINKALFNVNGAAASQGDFSIEVLGTYNEGEENEYRRVSIVWFEPFPASARNADWTVQTGARVKLTKNTRIGALDIPDASDVKIDLNGYELKVSSLTIEGEKKKGEFTAETLPAILIGEGKLVVGGSGLAIFVR